MDSYIWIHQYWPTSKNFIHQLCVDTQSYLEGLPRALINRERELREINAVSMPDMSDMTKLWAEK